MTKIIGRKRELHQLEEAYKAEESLFVVVYGRRRVGKTFLVREAFDDKLAFYATGVNQENKDVQLMYFYHALCKYSDAPLALPKTWLEAFDALIKILEASKEQKKVVFLDELSWMNGMDGSFLTALEWFWNSWASARTDILLVCCSSATSWIINNRNILVANVFNATSHWRVVAVEDGKEYLMGRLSGKGQDAFAAGYHHKYSESVSYRFVSKGNGYLIMNHLYYYTPRNPNARIIIKASDPYGNTYTASSDEVTTEPFANYAHYYEKEYKEYKSKKDKMLRDSISGRQKDSLAARKKDSAAVQK
jgi:hypothetical protein